MRGALALVWIFSVVGCGDDSSSKGPDDGGAPPPPPSGFTDPACTDGMYTESPPDPTASLADLTFTGDIPGLVDEALTRRYPLGLELVQGGRMNAGIGQDCSVFFAGMPSSARDVYGSLDTIVHECGHLDDNRLSSFSGNTYLIRDDLRFACRGGDTMARGGGTFERSRIRDDEYQHLRPACPPGSFSAGCDSYVSVYLDGDPDDASFDSGDQGYNLLLEEAVQYVNSLVTAWAFEDQLSSAAVSARDGILTMLWYIERYLHMARASYPDTYAGLSGDTCWRDATLTVWGRAWLYLELTRGERSLGLEDDAIETLVSEPALLDEIARLRAAGGCR